MKAPNFKIWSYMSKNKKKKKKKKINLLRNGNGNCLKSEVFFLRYPSFHRKSPSSWQTPSEASVHGWSQKWLEQFWRLNLGTTPGRPAAGPEVSAWKSWGQRWDSVIWSAPIAHVKTLTLDSESRFAGSAGIVNSTERVSTAMTPRGIPPNL